MRRTDRRIDVTSAAPELGTRIEMAVTITLPDENTMSDRPVAIFACPGGGYSRHYYLMKFAAHEGYDEAAWQAEHGIVHVAIDHVGVGESTIPDLSKISFQIMAATHDACVRVISHGLQAGSLIDGLPPMASLFKVGMGQSMGGGVSILTQGQFATFDAIAPFGVSAIHTVLPQRDAAAFEHGIRRFDAVAEGRVTSHIEHDHEGVDYVYPFHWEDVPADIVNDDMLGGFPIRETAPQYGSLTIPHCAVQMMLPGAFAAAASRISVPVLIGDGERDTCPAPHHEPSAYSASPDVSLFIVPRMAHMHNFASTREILWKRLNDWSRMVSTV